MVDTIITSVSTVVLSLVGFVQMVILNAQKKQGQLSLTEEYRKRWSSLRHHWGALIFIASEEDEYYQLLDNDELNIITKKMSECTNTKQTVWALDAVREVCKLLSGVCVNIFEGRLDISDVYSLFGTELLRYGKRLRIILNANYEVEKNMHGLMYTKYGIDPLSDKHRKIRTEVQDWLIYHDGIRRRCLILIDLLWSEAVRLEDLPPSDIKSAADAKLKSGDKNRNRLFNECIRICGWKKFLHAHRLSFFLRHSEYQHTTFHIGVKESRLCEREEKFSQNILRATK